MIVERMKHFQMQDRRHRPALAETHGLPAHDIFISLRPAIRSRHHAHPVRAQHVKFPHRVFDRDRLDVGIARDQKVRRDRFEKTRAIVARVRLRDKIEQRMDAQRMSTLEHFIRHPGDVFRHQLDRTVNDRIFHETFTRQRRVVAWRPARTAAAVELDDLRGTACFSSGAKRRRARPKVWRNVALFTGFLACVRGKGARKFAHGTDPPHHRDDRSGVWRALRDLAARAGAAFAAARDLSANLARRETGAHVSRARWLVAGDRRHVSQIVGTGRHADGRSADRQRRRPLRGSHDEFLFGQRRGLRCNDTVCSDLPMIAYGRLRIAGSVLHIGERGTPPNRLDSEKSDPLIRRVAFSAGSPWMIKADRHPDDSAECEWATHVRTRRSAKVAPPARRHDGLRPAGASALALLPRQCDGALACLCSVAQGNSDSGGRPRRRRVRAAARSHRHAICASRAI